jgi:hypothetical protein
MPGLNDDPEKHVRLRPLVLRPHCVIGDIVIAVESHSATYAVAKKPFHLCRRVGSAYISKPREASSPIELRAICSAGRLTR